jgi:hypothetical protein
MRFGKPLIIGFGFLALIFWYHHIDKLTPWSFSILIQFTIVILFIWIVIGIIKSSISIFRKNEKVAHIVGLLIYLSPIILLAINRCKLSSEMFESKVQMEGCYEGTQNQTHVLWRENGTFEINATGVFGYDKWWTGKWKRSKDTIEMKFDKNVFEALGEKVVIYDGMLIPFNKLSYQNINERAQFYLGPCKGKN